MVILVVLACLAMLGGAIFYNPLRRRMAGIIGVGGAYIVLIGVMLALRQRLQEIEGGEEDDAAQY